MAEIQSGHFVPVNRQRVTVWKSPDKDGDGEQVWEDQVDANGNVVGRRAVRDRDGNEIFHYEPPEGFINVVTKDPGSDGRADCWVRVDERGRVWRHPRTGETAEIRPGRVLVEHANGDVEYLDDEYSVYLYSKAHEPVSAPDDDSLVQPVDAAERDAAEADAADREAFEEWKRERASGKV